MPAQSNALGDYLRSRREQVRPEDVGLPSGHRRRVPGLRREELAILAGISGQYYLRLEQGRDKNPSAAILTAIARALQLDTTATEYLLRLAGHSESGQPDLDAVAYGLDRLIDQLPVPAMIANRYQDVLAANALASALCPGYAPGVNMLRWRLTDPAARTFFTDWDDATDGMVAGLREVAGATPGDARLRVLVDEFSTASTRFRELWARADVGYPTGINHVCHPEVGELVLHRYWLSVPHSGGQLLIIFQADAGSPSEEALRNLLPE